MGPDAGVADAARRAAARAVARSAYAVASTAYERAARLSPGPRRPAGRLLAAAENAWAAGLASSGARAAGRAASDAARAGADDECARAARVHRRPQRLGAGGGRAARARGRPRPTRPDVRAVLLAEALDATLLPRRRSSRGPAGRRADLGGGGRRRRRGRARSAPSAIGHGQGAGRPRRHRGAPRRRTAPGRHRRTCRRPPGRGVADVRPALHPGRRDGRELRAPGRRGTGRAGVGTLPGLLFLVARDGATTDSWAAGRGGLHRGDPAGAGHRPDHELAMSLAGLSWLESRSGQEAECRAHAEEALALGAVATSTGARPGRCSRSATSSCPWADPAAALGAPRRSSTPARGAISRRSGPLPRAGAGRRAAAAGPHRRGDPDGCGVRRGC